jgi:hypothetical protein
MNKMKYFYVHTIKNKKRKKKHKIYLKKIIPTIIIKKINILH